MPRKTDTQVILEYLGEEEFKEELDNVLLDNMNKTVIFLIILVLFFSGLGLLVYNIYSYLGGL